MAGKAPLLEIEPRLAEGLPAGEAEAARRLLAVEVVEIPTGPWDPPQRAGKELLGILVVDGLLARRLRVTGGATVELLSHGDLVRPWDEDQTSFSSIQWQVLAPVTAALLDAGTVSQAARWPGIIDRLLSASVRRSRTLAVHGAIDNVIGLRQRLHLLLWLLAERWGSVGPDGVTLPLDFPHRMLADLAGARRPSVTTALGELEREGLVSRLPDGSWLLRGEPPFPEDGRPHGPSE